MASVLPAAKPSRRNTLREPARIWSRFALALGPSSSVFVTNESSYLSKLNSTVYYESAREVCQGGLRLHTLPRTPLLGNSGNKAAPRRSWVLSARARDRIIAIRYLPGLPYPHGI